MTERPITAHESDCRKSTAWTKSSTFKAVKHLGTGFWLTATLLFALFLSLEVVLRADPLQPFLARMIPNLGSRHLQLEEQFARLARFAGTKGQVDCIFLGSSLVWLGLNPSTFEEAYERETGQQIRCFNFGVEALPANAAADLAEVLISDYHPRLLIYGTSARDYAIGRTQEESRAVSDTPWLQEKLGQKTATSWVVTNSYLVRYVKEISRLLRLERHSWNSLSQPDLSQGFLGKTTEATREHYEAAARDAARWLRPYEIQRENLQGLITILHQREKGIAVIVVEMPVNSQYSAYFENGRGDYTRFVTQLTRVAVAEDAILLRAPADDVIPEDGWWDRSHLNQLGAEAFSQWMANEVSQLENMGEIRPLGRIAGDASN